MLLLSGWRAWRCALRFRRSPRRALWCWSCARRSRLTGLALQLRPLFAAGRLVGPLQVIRPQLIALLLQSAALDVHLAADKLRRKSLTRKGAIPISLLWRNL